MEQWHAGQAAVWLRVGGRGGLLTLCRSLPACLPACPPASQAVAERSGRNVGQVLIRWALQHGTSVIPKSTSPARIKWVARWGS
jgi:hypothetical protein